MRKLAIFCAAFTVSALLWCYAPPLPYLLAAVCCLVPLTVGLMLRGKARTAVISVTLGFALGLLWCRAYAEVVRLPMTALAGTEQEVVVELCEYPQETSAGKAKATVRFVEPRLHGKAVYYGEESLFALVPGDRIRDTAECADAAFIRDEAVDTFTSRGVFLFLYGSEDAQSERGEGGLHYLPQHLAEKMKRSIDAVFPERTAPFMRSLLVGDKSQLSAADEVALSEAGLFHITAVSGLHCGFLLLIVTYLFFAVNRRMLAFFAIPILALYAMLTGASPSIVRACIMFSLMLIAPVFYRESDGVTSLLFSLFLILLQNPFAIASVSLQLSYGAVGGLLFLTPRLNRAIRKMKCGKLLRFVLASLSATAGALIFTTPLCAYYFGVVSLAAPLANLLCLGVASIVFGLGLAAAVFGMLLPPLGSLIAWAVHCGALYILRTAEVLTGIPHHAVYFENQYLWLWLFYAYALLALCAVLRKGRGRYAAWAVCSALVLFGCITIYEQSFSQNRANIVISDVGQGQSIVLVSGGESAVIDCGSSNYAESAGNMAADILHNAGCRKLEHLFITHVDADHVNGIETLLARMEVEEMIVPLSAERDLRRTALTKLAEENGTKVSFIYDEKEVFSVGELTISAYGFCGETAYLASMEDFDFLVTGDMSRSDEKKLVKGYALPDVEVLVAGHHGSKSSTGRELLDAVRAEVGIVSVGPNSYGHPTAEALYRMTDRNMAVYRTDKQGNIYIGLN